MTKSPNRLIADLINAAGQIEGGVDSAATIDLIAANALDSGLAQGIGLQTFTTLDSLPTTNLEAGDQAFVQENNRIYISNGSGWYNVALVNASPTLTVTPSGAIELSTAGSATTITLVGSDTDDDSDILSFSVSDSSGDFFKMATVSQDSSVFTVTPRSEDSFNTLASDGSSTLTFRVSDGIDQATEVKTFTLSFAIAGGKSTTLLLKADTSGNDNQVDASTGSHTITEAGNGTSTARTPYHPGGYSGRFDGSNDMLEIADATSLDLSTGDFTIEGWVWVDTDITDNGGFVGKRNEAYDGLSWRISYRTGDNKMSLHHYSEGSDANQRTPALNEDAWNHVAFCRSGSSLYCLANGSLGDTDASHSHDYSNAHSLKIGENGNSSYRFYGYMADVRIIKGTALYTGSYTVPTSRLTAVSNTTLLTLDQPYLADGSDEAHAITETGTVQFERFAPYDFPQYSKTAHGGSMYFDGTGDYLSVAYSADHTYGSGQFNIEFWVYMTAYEGTGFNTFLMKSDGTTNDWQFDYKNGTTQLRFIPYVSSSPETSAAVATATLGLRKWHHIAVSRDGSNNIRLFHNGSLLKTTSYSSTIDADGDATLEIGARQNSGTRDRLLNGYMSDLRIVKGSAVYTAAFTPPTEPLTAITNTTLLTCTNKHDVFEVSSGDHLYKYGNAGASDTKRKFTSSSSIEFDGSGDYIDIYGNNRAVQRFQSANDFTIEGWWLFDAITTRIPLISYGTGINGSPRHESNWNLYHYSGNLNFGKYDGSSSTIITKGWAPSTDTWYHIAVTRSSGSLRMFIDGTQIGTTESSNTVVYAQANDTDADPIRLGQTVMANTTYNLNGYAQDVRVTFGLARYTSNFTPSTSTFKA